MEKLVPLLAVLLVIVAALYCLRRRRLETGARRPGQSGAERSVQYDVDQPTPVQEFTPQQRNFLRFAEEYRDLFYRLQSHGFVCDGGDVIPGQITTQWRYGEEQLTVYVTDIGISCAGDDGLTLQFEHLRFHPKVRLVK